VDGGSSNKESRIMFPRWLWLNHIPAGLDLTAEQRAAVSRLVRQMGSGQRRFTPMSRRMLVRLVPAMAILTLSFGAWLLWLIRARPGGGGGWTISFNLLGIMLFQALVWIVIAWSINRAIAPLVWRALNQAGFRVCEGCGYILDYLPLNAERCPECGAASLPPMSANEPAPPSAANGGH
jgi:hypothetical protein